MNLSTNFTLREFNYSATAVRLGIKNVMPEELVENAIRVAEEILQPVRDYFSIPFSISSGYRCLDLNRVLKSKDTSQHTKGEAVDIEVPTVSNKRLADWIAENCIYDQLILEFHNSDDPMSGWVHVSIADTNRHQLLTISPGGNTIEGLR